MSAAAAAAELRLIAASHQTKSGAGDEDDSGPDLGPNLTSWMASHTHTHTGGRPHTHTCAMINGGQISAATTRSHDVESSQKHLQRDFS